MCDTFLYHIWTYECTIQPVLSTDDHTRLPPIFTARCYASAVLAMAPCLSVCLSVRPSQVGVLLKRLNVGSHKQHHTIAQGLQFSDAKDLLEVRPGSPPTGAPNAGGVGRNLRLSTNNWLDAWLLLKSNRKSYALYRMATLSAP